jgi:hypothetical protein
MTLLLSRRYTVRWNNDWYMMNLGWFEMKLLWPNGSSTQRLPAATKEYTEIVNGVRRFPGWWSNWASEYKSTEQLLRESAHQIISYLLCLLLSWRMMQPGCAIYPYISCRIFVIVNKWAYWKIEILSAEYSWSDFVFCFYAINVQLRLLFSCNFLFIDTTFGWTGHL